MTQIHEGNVRQLWGYLWEQAVSLEEAEFNLEVSLRYPISDKESYDLHMLGYQVGKVHRCIDKLKENLDDWNISFNVDCKNVMEGDIVPRLFLYLNPKTKPNFYQH